ncbi:DNA pilot protein [Microviridae sp.]|nr:DNA pilot protein [Microviridae sp.]
MCKTNADIRCTWSNRSFLMSLLAAGATIVGSMMRNQAAKAASARQMAFQEDMSNTSYQRGMADMKKAGLNPILAGKMGGASTPTGSTYNPENITANAANTAFQVAQAQNMQQQERLNRQNADYFDKKPYGSAVLNARPANILLTEILERNPQIIDELSKGVATSSKSLLKLLSGDLTGLFERTTAKEPAPIKLLKGNMPIKTSPMTKVKIKKDRWDIRLRRYLKNSLTRKR